LQQLAADQQLADGLTQNAAAVGTIQIDGKPQTAATIAQVLLGRVATAKAVETTRTVWQAAVKANKEERANTREFVLQVRQALIVAFASNVEMLGRFGLSPRKKAAVKPETKVVAATKAAATRQARGTAGKKQKARIKGKPPATVTLPVAPGTMPEPAPPKTANPATPATPATVPPASAPAK
jgi:hypothetical protein